MDNTSRKLAKTSASWHEKCQQYNSSFEIPLYKHYLHSLIFITFQLKTLLFRPLILLSIIMHQLHVMFFPFMAQGHMIPTIDIAKLFATHGVKSTIIATPSNAKYFTNAISKTTKLSGNEIAIRTVRFPSVEAGLPENCENVDQVPSEDLVPKFFIAIDMLQDQIEQILKEEKPDCLVADMFIPWATEIAAKYKIPRLVFHGTNFFSLCAGESLRLNKPQNDVKTDDEPFILPNLPHEIKLTRMQLSPDQRQVTDTDKDTNTDTNKYAWLHELMRQVKESETTSYGVIVNSFLELEPEYVDHFRNVLKRRAWHIGPVSLCNRENEDKAQRGKEATIDQHACIKWLDSKKPNSVVYVCFGSLAKFSASQLHEIAMGLEDSGHNFIWVVRKWKNVEEEDEEWLPEGFEKRTKETGLIIRGWAPQVLILDHEAIGCFVTHCGWNSTLESITAGVPMVTWPVFAEQFFNEKLVTDILKIGVGVGSTWKGGEKGVDVKRETITNAMKEVMCGDEAEAFRNRAKALKKSAKEAVEEGGSSYYDLKALLKDLSLYSV